MLAHPYSCQYTRKQPFQCDLLEALLCGFPPRQDPQSEMFIEENLENYQQSYAEKPKMNKCKNPYTLKKYIMK